MMRTASLLLCAGSAAAFVTPISHVAPAPRTALRAVPETLSALQHTLPTSLTAFADQGGNLAGKFFQYSLAPYLGFLYFLKWEKNGTPPTAFFGFQFLLLFVVSTVVTGIVSKSVYGCSLADVDWLHGTAESLDKLLRNAVSYCPSAQVRVSPNPNP